MVVGYFWALCATVTLVSITWEAGVQCSLQDLQLCKIGYLFLPSVHTPFLAPMQTGMKLPDQLDIYISYDLNVWFRQDNYIIDSLYMYVVIYFSTRTYIINELLLILSVFLGFICILYQYKGSLHFFLKTWTWGHFLCLCLLYMNKGLQVRGTFI